MLHPTALERDDRIAKFRFKYLGIVEVHLYLHACLYTEEYIKYATCTPGIQNILEMLAS